MDKKIAALIDSYQGEFVDMLSRWIRIPSVKADPLPGAPFGQEIARMMDVAAADCAAIGLDVRTFDGYAIDATLGGMDREQLAVLAHLDVVPVGNGWTVEPFGAELKGDTLYGRGTSDDKGPALCALFAMKALKEAGIPLKKGIRLILGGDEESGWEDMAYYCAHTEVPEEGFSPDASFPLINTEKGMVHLFVKAPVSAEGLQVLQLYNGERLNVIPGESSCIVAGGDEIIAAAEAFAKENGLDIAAEKLENGVKLTAHGIGGHSAYPFQCRNANAMLLVLLRALGVQGALKLLADAYPLEHDGKAMHINCEDAISGPLTCNVGILHLEDGCITASFDCRCPVCADLEGIRAAIIKALPGFEVQDSSVKEAHHVPADTELVSSLLAAYEEETGLKGEAMATGGGTYAKVLRRGVAFGTCFPDETELAHQPDECVSISRMMKAAKVYANALIRLCAE